MILSIGIDTVTISNVERFLDNPVYARDIFTEKELELLEQSADIIDESAKSFAAKQAVKKVLDHFMNVEELSLTRVEIFKKEGIPYVAVDREIQEILDGKGVKNIMVSITSEGDIATAFVIAQQ